MNMSKHSPLLNWTPKVYSRLAKYYDRFAPIFLSIGEKAKKRVAQELKSGFVLDVACGTGALLAMAHNQGLTCYGSDLAEGMIAEAQKKIPNGEFRIASFYELPFEDDTFDYVVETNAVSGVFIEVEKVIAEMMRVCKPGGFIIIGDYCKAPKETSWTRFMEWIGILIGDYPHDFQAIFRDLGYQPEVEYLGWSGMYQFIKVKKRD
jgi:ubiquinone/menaquinone biosynthesis C-methylase UbiE